MPTTTFVLLSFEGPDLYSHAGGVGSRVDELSRTLAARGLETHLFFIGDPALPGYEVVHSNLHLHRWCQWISDYYPGGVYDGEEAKLRDWQDSLPRWLTSELIAPKVTDSEDIVILAEEWQTAETVVRLADIVRRNGWQRHVHLLWNANNTFSFDRIDWSALDRSATLTTVSRYMKREMWDRNVDPRVIPNGIDDAWLQPASANFVSGFKDAFAGRLSVLKVGRFDPNKRWLPAIEAVALLKQADRRPLLIARGGSEAHGWEVYNRASELGLSVRHCECLEDESLPSALARHLEADIVFLEDHVNFEDRKALYQACQVVLANSAIEPFGLVGLEAMASGGLVMVGSTGEDYSLSGHDSISLQTANPREIVHQITAATANRRLTTRMRKAARASAARFTWSAVLDRSLLPLLYELGVPRLPAPAPASKRASAQASQESRTGEGVLAGSSYLLAANPSLPPVAPPIAPA